MKTLFISFALCAFSVAFGQKSKDLTKEQIIQNKDVQWTAQAYNLTPEQQFDVFKCMKETAHIKYFKSLPYFNKKLAAKLQIDDIQAEKWKIISEQCRDSVITN